MTRRAGLAPGLLLLAALVAGGCGPSTIDTSYGRSRGSSINGTSVLAELFRQRGDEVRAAVRLTDTLSEWADVLVRFSMHPGPPDEKEGRWMLEWLEGRPGRRLVYVVRDFDAEPDFWSEMIRVQPQDAPAKRLDSLKRNLDQSRDWVASLPPRPKTPAKAIEWFAVDPKPPPPSTCRTLEGPWAEGIDAGAAAISRHEGFRVEEDDQPVLLRGEGTPLAIAWTLDNGSRVLALANASFLLNASLLNRARRPLASRVVDWTGPGSSHVGFVEGDEVVTTATDPDTPESSSAASSPFRLFQVSPFGRIAAHVLIFLLLLALAYAVRLGRPRPEPPSGVERPSAHPEALGVLLARTGRADTARSILENYRRWRHPSSGSGRAAPAAPSSPPSPRA